MATIKKARARFGPTEDAAPVASRRSVVPVSKSALINENTQLREQFESLKAQFDNMSKLIAAERPAALPARLNQDREEWYRLRVIEWSKSCLERTQDAAIEQWGDETDIRFLVDVEIVEKGHPRPDLHPLLIPARSKHEAKGRYEEINNILSLDHQVRIVAVRQAA